MINADIKKYIDQSVLCWLATCDRNLIPNVSPKEIFTCQDDSKLLIANIASQGSVSNIILNPFVCVSFIDVFVQKGYKIKGKAKIIERDNFDFEIKVKPLVDLYSDKIPIKSVIEIEITHVEPIIAPGYYLFPDTSEESQIASAMATYKVRF